MKIKISLLAVLVAFCCFAEKAMACTNIIVGKNASADGSVIVSYNADSYGMYGNMHRHVGGTHSEGEKRKVYEWDTNKYLGEIPQAKRTYNVVGQMNENQVSITETTFGGREELADSTAIMDYGSLIYIALERATSARDAIKIMTDLVSKYGYYSEGETFSICDKNEAWVMEMIGKGVGEKGAVWVAIRIPDDCICTHANQSRITRFIGKYPKADVMYSKDVVSFARKKGYFTGKKDSEFSFRDAYNPLTFSGVRFCDARAWSIMNKFCDGMAEYEQYAQGNDLKGEMPLFVQPKKKLTVRDVMSGMRDHYEGTSLDVTVDAGAGAYSMPYRPSPLTWKSGDKEYFNERPVSTQQTGFSFVGQMRASLPNEIGGVVWWTNDDPNMAAYTPIYCSVSEVPACYLKVDGKQDDITFSMESAFWVENMVSNIVYPYYSKMYPDLQKCQKGLEDEYFAKQATVEARAKNTLGSDRNETIKLLTSYSTDAANKMMAGWKELFQFLVVKHNDMCIKPTDSEGNFTRSKYGLGGRLTRPGYPEDYRKVIVNETKDKFLNK